MENASLQIEITVPDQMHRVETSLNTKLESLPCFDSKTLAIYKVPKYIREGNEVHYLPLVVSIGPIFYKDPRLEAMQELKLGCLKYFRDHSHNGNLENYIKYVREKEQQIRDCYEEHISLSSDEFIEMIVIDAVFLICFFKSDLWDSLQLLPFLKNKLQGYLLKDAIRRDVLMVENQLPFFILNDIFDMTFCREDDYTPYSFTHLIIRTLCTSLLGHKAIDKIIDGKNIANPSNTIHFVDLVDLSIYLWREDRPNETLTDSGSFMRKAVSGIVRLLCCGLSQICENKPEYESEFSGRSSKTAKQLKDAGVKFVKSDSDNPLDITFADGKLAIPRLFITDSTESVWRNIIYFEQSHPQRSTMPFTDYILFLDELIDTVDDVQVLVDSNILDNDLGSESDTIKIFNKVARHWEINGSTYDAVSKKANGYASTPWNQWMATLRTKYFYNPWVTISVIAAFILFVLTLLQTISGFVYK